MILEEFAQSRPTSRYSIPGVGWRVLLRKSFGLCQGGRGSYRQVARGSPRAGGTGHLRPRVWRGSVSTYLKTAMPVIVEVGLLWRTNPSGTQE